MDNLKTVPKGLPAGKAVIVAIAIAATPFVWRAAKRVGRALAKGAGDLVEKAKRDAEEPHDPARTDRQRRTV